MARRERMMGVEERDSVVECDNNNVGITRNHVHSLKSPGACAVPLYQFPPPSLAAVTLGQRTPPRCSQLMLDGEVSRTTVGNCSKCLCSCARTPGDKDRRRGMCVPPNGSGALVLSPAT